MGTSGLRQQNPFVKTFPRDGLRVEVAGVLAAEKKFVVHLGQAGYYVAGVIEFEAVSIEVVDREQNKVFAQAEPCILRIEEVKDRRGSTCAHIKIAGRNQAVAVVDRQAMRGENTFAFVFVAEETFLDAVGSIEIDRSAVACMQRPVPRRNDGLFEGVAKVLAAFANAAVGSCVGDVGAGKPQPVHAEELFVVLDVRAGKNSLMHAIPPQRQQLINLVGIQCLRCKGMVEGGHD